MNVRSSSCISQPRPPEVFSIRVYGSLNVPLTMRSLFNANAISMQTIQKMIWVARPLGREPLGNQKMDLVARPLGREPLEAM
jgi:hypothetical protein